MAETIVEMLRDMLRALISLLTPPTVLKAPQDSITKDGDATRELLRKMHDAELNAKLAAIIKGETK